MDDIKGERRKWKQSNSMPFRISRFRCGLRLSLELLSVLAGTALFGCAFCFHHDCLHSSLYGAVTASLQFQVQNKVVNCGPYELSNQNWKQKLYDEYRRKHANLEIKLLSESDGAPILQSHQPPRAREITIITQATIDRWPQLEKMATSWGGALCVAVHVKTRAEIAAAREKMMWLHDHIEAQRHCRLHLQMVVEEGFNSETDALKASYPVNALRNVALDMANTELVFLVDVDFVPSPRLHEKLTANEKLYSELVARTSKRGQLLVVPAFQLQPADVPRGVHPRDIPLVEEPIPQSMQELRERWDNGSITSFHWYHPRSHESTSYSHFLHPLTTEPYHVQYEERYEPYFVAARAIIPKFDERFRGYGKNKISHSYNCAARGLDFVVLPGVYLWEIPHTKSTFYTKFFEEKQQPCHIDIMNVVYGIFKEELQAELRKTS